MSVFLWLRQLGQYFEHLLTRLLQSGPITTSGGPSKFTVASKTWRVVRPLGEGGFAFVYLVRSAGHVDEESGRPRVCALKHLKLQTQEQEESFRRELKYHQTVVHERVIRLIDGEFREDANGMKHGYLVFPYFKNGTVQDLIDNSIKTKQPLKLQVVMDMFLDVCEGLTVFHSLSPSLAFRDLKPANILIDDNGRGVLMDFGSVAEARITIANRREALSLQDHCAETCTAPFRPPELFDVPSEGKIDERTDVWSLGCTLYAMVYGQSPFDGTATSAIGRVTFAPSQLEMFDAFRELVLYMLNVKLDERPTVDEALEKARQLQLLKRQSNSE